ncbi:MAG: hypothetical protein LBO79_04705 [Zoogloeaceae bacterium]|nr:hypothetical protein [Zoogloeaceae bacterium]
MRRTGQRRAGQNSPGQARRPRSRKWAALFCLALPCCLAFLHPVFAQEAPSLPDETPEALRKNLDIIQHYNNEVQRRVEGNRKRNAPAARSNAPAAEKAGDGESLAQSLAEKFAPITIAPPRTSITPDAPDRLIDAIERDRDPFEVSPRLREAGSQRGRPAPTDGVTLSRELRLRALARGPEGGIAQIQTRNELILVHDGDELDVNGIRYTVHVEADGLVLRGAGAPQFRMLIR